MGASVAKPEKVPWWACTVCKELVVRHGEPAHVSVPLLKDHAKACGKDARFVTKRIQG